MGYFMGPEDTPSMGPEDSPSGHQMDDLLYEETKRIISDITIVQQVRDASTNIRCKECQFLKISVLALSACGT